MTVIILHCHCKHAIPPQKVEYGKQDPAYSGGSAAYIYLGPVCKASHESSAQSMILVVMSRLHSADRLEGLTCMYTGPKSLLASD